MIKNIILAIATFLLWIPAYSQNSNIDKELESIDRNSLDSLNKLSKTMACTQIAKSDSIADLVIDAGGSHGYPIAVAYALKNKGINQLCQGNFKESLQILNRARSLFTQNNDLKGEVITLNYMASSHLRLSNLDSAKIFNDQQIILAKASQDSLLIASSFQMKSGIHTMLSENDSVIFYAILGLRIAEKINNKGLESNLNISIGNAYYQNEDYKDAYQYYDKAKKLIIESQSSNNLNLIYYNIGVCLTKLDHPDSALNYFNKSIELNKQQGSKYILTYCYQGLADAYFNLKRYEEAIQTNLLSKEMSIKLGEKRSLATVLSNLAACYSKVGDSPLAIISAKEAIKIDKEIGDLDKEADGYWLLSEAYSLNGDHELSLEAFKKFYSIDSSLISRDKSKTINELETKYDTEKKEAEIATLSHQATIQALEIKQKNQAITIGVILILFISMGIYLIYRQRTLKRIGVQTELEQRFLRSQLNPHFIFNALSAIQNFMLKNNAQTAGLYLTKFSKLMREILENSRKEFITVESEVEMLTNYLDIHKLRLNNSFEYKIELDDDIDPETDTIPPMFIQPFVENAIEHGLINTVENGLIELNFSKQNEYIAIELLDNGQGFTTNISPSEHKSLATTIIKERMALFNRTLKNRIQLLLEEIKNEKGEIQGTKVELKVPFSYI